MPLPTFLVGLLAVVASTTASPINKSSVRDIAAAACVQGNPTVYGGWTIEYQMTWFPDKGQDGSMMNPDWAGHHEKPDSASTYSIGTSEIGYVENKCQFTCNAMADCVAFASYQSVDSTPDKGEIVCHYFTSLIGAENVVSRPAETPLKLVHAYNKLCNQRKRQPRLEVVNSWDKYRMVEG